LSGLATAAQPKTIFGWRAALIGADSPRSVAEIPRPGAGLADRFAFAPFGAVGPMV
jgi:hypothetical protein